jgi:TonB-linked SusC/RagA family outer membrane protein
MRKLMALAVSIALLHIGHVLAQTTRTVTGTVTDEKGNTLSNVTISAMGAERRVIRTTLSDANGNFSIQVPERARGLQFSFVGYEEQFVALGSGNSISVKLVSNSANLSEIVVVGYGTQRRKEATGNLAVVKGSEVAQKPVQSFEQALAGQAPGVQITVPNGIVNNPPVFRIRGVNSISLSSYPLVVVDGIPTYTLDQGGTSAPANPLASINPNDIESIDIAKDAAASAIYGSRAAAGVVFITTKKGKSGKAKVSYNGWVGFTKPNRLPEILDANQYVDYKNVALANLKVITPATTGGFIIPTDAKGNPINTNWYDEAYRNALSHSHNVSISGGSEATSYYLSAGYTKQEGILRKNDFERKNILLNIDSRVNKVISLGGKVSYSNENNLIGGTSGSLPGEAFASAGTARLAFALPPNVAPYNNDGTYNIASATAIGAMGNVVNGANPYSFNNLTMLLNLNRSNNEVQHLQSNAYIQVKPLSWITLRSVYGIDNLFIDNDIFYNPYHGDGAGTSNGPGGGGTASYTKNKTWIWTNTAQFDYTFADKHSFSLLVGGEQQRRTFLGFGINRRTLSDSAYTNVEAGFTTNNATGMGIGDNYLLSKFGRLNYNFDKKYFISGNIRQDEYSALGQKKGTFWGVSAGWEVANEQFWKTAHLDHVFSSFKLRGSYGKVGNIAGIGDYSTFSTYSSGLYGGTATLAFNSVGNNQLRWETSKKTDIGVAFGLFNDKLTADIAYYNNNIDGLILNVPQSPSTGLPGSIGVPPTLLANAGTMYNKGIEVGINATPISNKDFSWTSSFNFAYNKNKVTSLAPGLTEILTATSSLETVSKTLPGYSAGYLWVIRTGGIDPETGRRIFINSAGNKVLYQFGSYSAQSGQFNYSNPDGTKYVNPKSATNANINQTDDAVLYANTIPKYIGGWNNTFRYKDFDLNVLMTYQAGFYVYYGSNAGLHDQRFWNNSTDVLNYWKQKGDNAAWPKPIYGDNVSNGSAMPLDINVFKGDFIKLKTVTLGYSLPSKLISRSGLSGARIYVSAQNLAIITSYPGPDPEVSSNGAGVSGNTSQGVDRNTLANGRTFTVGLNLNF